MPTRRTWFHALGPYLASVCLVVLLSLPNLPLPFSDSQAVLVTGADVIKNGGVLYRDFRGAAEPAAFLFYFLGGALFGYSEYGVHAFELLYHMAFCGFLVFTLRHEFTHRWLTGLAPVAAIGAYYMLARPSSMTVPEILAAFPLYLCIWFAGHTWSTSRKRAAGYFCSGVAGGLAALFKFWMAPVAFGVWIVAAVIAQRVNHHRSAALLRQRIAPALSGFTLMLSAAGVWLWEQNALADLYRIAVSNASLFQGQALVNVGDPIAALWFVRDFAAWILLAAVACFSLQGRLFRRPFWAGLACWAAVGGVLIGIENTPWTPNRFLAITPAVGLLAVRGLDRLLSLVRLTSPASSWRVPVTACAGTLLILSPELLNWTAKARALTPGAVRNEPAPVEFFQRRMDTNYDAVRTSTRFLSAPDAKPGSVFVFGSPILLWLSGRRPALAVNGWDLEGWDAQQWDAVAAQLRAQPPAYVFVDPGYESLIADMCPALTAWLKSDYRAVQTDGVGVWYRHEPR